MENDLMMLLEGVETLSTQVCWFLVNIVSYRSKTGFITTSLAGTCFHYINVGQVPASFTQRDKKPILGREINRGESL